MYTVTIKQLIEQPTAVIRTTAEPATLTQTFDDVFTTTWAAVEQSGRTAVGAPFARWFSFTADAMEVEGGIPVDAPFTSTGRVVASSLPGGEAASLDHVGDYENLAAAHSALNQWLVDESRQAAGPVWEVYWTDPSTEPDSAKWRTELIVPLAPRLGA